MSGRTLLTLAAALASSACLHAQAVATATRGGILQAGVTVSSANTDEFKERSTGISGYGTFDFNQHLGVEVDAHFLSILTPYDFIEDSFLAGPRYVYRVHRFEPYAKGLIGMGRTSIDDATTVVRGTPGSYLIYGVAGGLDIRLPHRINIRAIDYEMQFWSGYPPDGLTPVILSAGLAYRIR